MSPRPLLILTTIVLGFQLLISGWALLQVPADARVPIHWGLSGEPDGYADAWVAFLLTPAITLPTGLLLAFAPRFDPRRENLARSAVAYRWIVGSVQVMMAGVHVTVVMAGLGYQVDVVRLIGVAVGALFVVIGNFLGKTRSSWFMGIRTPWTLSSERSWDRTHRLGGYLFMAIGLLTALTALILPPEAFFWVLMAGMLGSVAFLFVYSYLVWREDPDRRTL